MLSYGFFTLYLSVKIKHILYDSISWFICWVNCVALACLDEFIVWAPFVTLRFTKKIHVDC